MKMRLPRFLDGVARMHEYLRAGDVFQVNLSREWRVHCDDDAAPGAIYAALRQRQSGAVRGSSAARRLGDRQLFAGAPDRGARRLAQTRPDRRHAPA